MRDINNNFVAISPWRKCAFCGALYMNSEVPSYTTTWLDEFANVQTTIYQGSGPSHWCKGMGIAPPVGLPKEWIDEA